MRDSIRALRAAVLLSACTANVFAQGHPAGAALDFARFDVCEAVPGDVFEQALGAKLVQLRPFFDKSFARCVYLLAPRAGGEPAGYVLWVQPENDFSELRKYIDDPVTPVDGLGDDAYMFHDSGDGRFKLNVLQRGRLMFQLTSGSQADLRRLAPAVFVRLSAPRR